MVEIFWKVMTAFVFVFVFVLAGAMCASGMPAVFPAFSSITLDGEYVSSGAFSEEKLTMINLWATWCPPCIREMPDLGNLGRSMPEGSQLIGIILDVGGPGDTNVIDQAKRITSMANADFVQVFPSGEMAPVLDTVRAVPTTIFVDSAGNIIGAPVVGARDESGYRAEIEKRLESLQ